MTRVAVIGVGAMGRNHARVYWEMGGVELVGVADVNAELAEAVARRYSTHGYDDYRRLLDEQEPHAVTVAVPTDDHLAIALEVLQRGIHLLIEKPIAFTVDEGRQIVAAAEAAGALLTVGHIERFNPAVVALKEHLAEGQLGRVFQLDARRQGPFPARVKDVGVVIDLAVHDLDVMRFVSGAEIVRIYAETERRIHSTREDLVVGLVRLEDGAIGSLAINWLTPTKIRELCVTGERGMFRVDYLTQDLFFYENASADGDGWEALHMLRGVSEGRMIRYVVAKQEPLRAEQEAFLAAVRGEGPVAVTGADGLRALELAQAVVMSGLGHQALAATADESLTPVPITPMTVGQAPMPA
jgi:UDP-N-acetylglucosamine 3-dehydrogenase